MSTKSSTSAALRRAITDHSRNWRNNRYVYPVCSRRSGGISIGVNLNPDKVCNFDCIYCQVDRSEMAGPRDVDVVALRGELDDMLARVVDGRLFAEPEFADLPESLRRLNDVAFSGDGEPTTCPQFIEAVTLADELVQQRCGHQPTDLQPKLVLITNATMFHRPTVRAGLEVMHRHRGEIWGKLDAGTEQYYRMVERTSIPLARVVENLTWAARTWPIVIQALFMRVQGQGPGEQEIAAFCDRLAEIRRPGGQIQLVQVYTVARAPAEAYVTPLSRDEVDAIADAVRARFGNLKVAAFYGPE
jgi:wyosine [tRNA(Phe)-imidazoG37] synthetase (radical SAM superfamily)